MAHYNTARFEPPAPLAYVTLRNPDTGLAASNVPMLLDTGADVSLIPHTTLKVLDLTTSRDRLYELKSFDGSTSYSSVVQIELTFCNRTFRGKGFGYQSNNRHPRSKCS